MNFPYGTAFRVRAAVAVDAWPVAIVKEELAAYAYRPRYGHLHKLLPLGRPEMRTDFRRNRRTEVVSRMFNQIDMNIVIFRAGELAVDAFAPQNIRVMRAGDERGQTDIAALANAFLLPNVHDVPNREPVCR